MKTNYIAIALLVAVVGVFGLRASQMSPANINRHQLRYYYDKITSGQATPEEVIWYKEALEKGIIYAQAELEERRLRTQVMRGPNKIIEAQITVLEEEIKDLKAKLAKLEIK